MATKYAVATLLTDDSYLPGALTAVHSLKDVQQGEDVPGTAYETVCLITPETVSVASIRKAKDVFDKVISVDAIESASARELALLGRPDLKATLTKLHLWRLTQYRRIIYLDADTLVIRPILHLFERYARAPISAAPDNGWPDAFNSGFILLSPDQQHFDGLSSMARERGSWDGGDQGLLNDYFEGNWDRLSFTYNVTPSAFYQYQPAMRRYGNNISVLHFIGRDKPWSRLHRLRSHPSTSTSDDAHSYEALLNKWYDVYERHYGQLSTAVLTYDDPAAAGQGPQADFQVPSYSNAWNQTEQQSSFQPAHPDDLKQIFGRNSILAQYAAYGYHLDGQDQTAPAQRDHQPPRAQQQGRPPSPPMFPWDATTQAPDKEKMQMAQPMDHHYNNAWDAPKAQSSRPYKPPSDYNAVPREIQSQYPVTQQPQTSASSDTSSKTVFPFEQRSSSPARRVFPDDTAPRPQSPAASYTKVPGPSLSRSRSAQEPSRPAATGSAFAGLPRDLGYSNAWDSNRGIQRYFQSAQPGSAFQPRSRQASDASQRQSGYIKPSRDPAAGSSSSSPSSVEGQEGDDEQDEAYDGVALLEALKQKRASKGGQGSDRPFLRRASASAIDTKADYPAMPTPDPEAQAPPSLPDNIVSVHKRQLSLPSIRAANRKQTSRSPLPSPGSRTSSFGNIPNPGAKRVFHPSTDTNIVRKEGMAALHRFVQHMEQRGLEAEQQDVAHMRRGST